MKTWTKNQVITYTILLVLLIVDLSLSLLVLIYRDSFSPSSKDVNADRLEFWITILYGLILFGSFPLITLVITLNQDQLQKLNIDKFYFVLLIACGLAGLYSLPYNCFAGIAAIYAVYTLLVHKARFGIADESALRIILLIVGVFAGILICMIGLVDATKIDILRAEQWTKDFIFDTIPISVYQEAVFRGILYMFLKDLNLSESKIFYTQAFLFWITHIHYLFQSPVFFWIIIPASGLIFGYLAFRTKSITPSAIAHILSNALIGFSELVW